MTLQASFTDADASYVVVPAADRTRIDAWSSRRMPFEPRGWLVDLRAELRTAVAAMRAPNVGEILSATYASDVRAHCDVEHVTLFNVGPGHFRVAARHGLRFERSYIPPPAPVQLDGPETHHVRYSFALRNTPPSGWLADDALASWEAAPLPSLSATTSCSAVWRAVRTCSSLAVRGRIAPGHPYGMRLAVGVPSGERVALASIVKPLFDGAIAALGAHDGIDLQLASLRLAAQTGDSPEAASRLLMDEQRAVFEPRRLLWPYRESVQWNPPDDACVFGELLVEDSDRWGLTGEVFALSLAPVGHVM
jgi:hypothetical protein